MSKTLQKAFDFQAIYNGLYLHFNKSYDYSKYGPLRKNQNPEKFEISPDRFIFLGFVRKFKSEDVFEEYLKLYGFRNGSVPYLRNFDDSSIEEELRKTWMKIRHSFNYQLDDALREISLEDLRTNGQSWPEILTKTYDGDIYPSFLVLLDRTYNLMDRYAKIFSDDILFQEKFRIYTKYRSVTSFSDLDELKTYVKTQLKTT